MFDFLTEAWNSTVGFFDIILLFLSLVVGYLIFKFLSKLTLPAILVGQIAGLAVYFTLLFAFLTFFTTALVYLYNKIMDLGIYLGSMPGASCIGSVLECAGIDNLMSLFYSELFFILITVLIFRLSFMFVSVFEKISEKIWRIGMMIGQM